MNPDTTSHTENAVGTVQNPKIVLLGALAVLIIILASLAYGYYRFGSVLSFQGLRYVAGSYETRALYEVGWTGTKQVSLPVSGRVIDYAQAGDAEAAILDSGDGMQTVHLFSPGAARALSVTPGIRTSLAVSSDGTKVAYAERIPDAPDARSTASFYDPESWSIRVHDTVTGEVATMGNGYGTALFVRGGNLHLAYGTAEGMHIANLDSGQHQDIALTVPEDSRMFPIVVAGDGSYVAIPSPSATYALFALKEENGVYVLIPAGTLPEQARAVAFRGNSIFSASRSSVESFLYTSPVASPEKPSKWYRMPYVLITKLIP